MTALVLATKGEKPGHALVCGFGCKFREKKSSHEKKCVVIGKNPSLTEDGRECGNFQKKNGA